MDYKRRTRNITYHSSLCKMYLRHDFEHRCSYCQVSEDIVSNIAEIGEMIFEKDHFLPQSGGSPDVHKYSNLFYACRKCNKLKDDSLLSLNPCEDNIFSGGTPHISGGSAKTNFYVTASTAKGTKYIDDLQLNSRYHVDLRQSQHRYLECRSAANQILQELQSNQKIDDRMLETIRAAVNPISTTDPAKYICGNSAFGTHFVNASHLLSSHGHPCEFVFEDNELDIAVCVNDIQYWGQLRITDRMQSCRVKMHVLQEWEKRKQPCAIFQYIPKEQRVCFCVIDFDKVNWHENSHRVEAFIDL